MVFYSRPSAAVSELKGIQRLLCARTQTFAEFPDTHIAVVGDDLPE